MLDASLGYFINPVVNIAPGMLFLKEKLRRFQRAALSLAIIGVMIHIFIWSDSRNRIITGIFIQYLWFDSQKSIS